MSFEVPECGIVIFFSGVPAWFKCECCTCILFLSDKKPHGNVRSVIASGESCSVERAAFWMCCQQGVMIARVEEM